MTLRQFWIVGEDETQVWSSEDASFVLLPVGMFLTVDEASAAGVQSTDLVQFVPTRIASEEELTDVLAVYGLSGPIVRVPDRVSARQFRLQLRIAGIHDQVAAWVATQNPLVQDAFEYSGEFVRSEPMMEAGFSGLGFNGEAIDAFFVAASHL